MKRSTALATARRSVLVAMAALLLCAATAPAQSKKQKVVAGKADVLRHVPKQFATLVRVDAESRQVELQLEGETKSRTWKVQPDAELKIHGWWGRLGDFNTGDRVWVWFAVDRKKQPRHVLMLADEISQQVLNGLPHTLKSIDAAKGTVVVESAASGERKLRLADKVDPSGQLGKQVFVQTAGDTLRIALTEQQLESMRRQQQERLRKLWRTDGLPGTVVFLHPLSGEMDLMLDHESQRWGRYLKHGDQVVLATAEPIKAVVKEVRPWRERTLLRLVTGSGVDQADLSLGQRVGLRVPEPPADVQASNLPSDIGRLEEKQARVDWFLASVYCPCKIAGNRCTGMFYTLASCNVNACGMPNHMRQKVGEMIDKKMSDEEIWHALGELRGRQVYRQHLLR